MNATCVTIKPHNSHQGSLATHKQSNHDGVRYDCDMCDYQATIQSNLARHKQSKHEGVRYDYVLCDYQSTQQGTLATHKKI